jgi:hypothetical protein
LPWSGGDWQSFRDFGRGLLGVKRERGEKREEGQGSEKGSRCAKQELNIHSWCFH